MKKKITLCIVALLLCMFPMNTWAEEERLVPMAVYYDDGSINHNGYQYNFRLELYTLYAAGSGNSSGSAEMRVLMSAKDDGGHTNWAEKTGFYSMQAEAYPVSGYVLVSSHANCRVNGSLTGLNLGV